MKTLLQSDRAKTVLTLLALVAGLFLFCVLCSSCMRTPLPKEDPALKHYHSEVKARRAKLKRGWYTMQDNVRRDTLTSATTGLTFPVTQP